MTTKNKKQPKLQLKKQTLAKLDERQLEKTKGGRPDDDDAAESVTSICVSHTLKCMSNTQNHNRRVLAVR